MIIAAAASIYDLGGFRQLRSSRACIYVSPNIASPDIITSPPPDRPAAFIGGPRTDCILSYPNVYFVRFIFEPKRRVLTFRRAGGVEAVFCSEVKLGKFYFTANTTNTLPDALIITLLQFGPFMPVLLDEDQFLRMLFSLLSYILSNRYRIFCLQF